MPFEISKSQLKEFRFLAKKKFSRAREMFFPSRDALEASTPEPVALHRAQRLSSNILMDIGCGIGMDSIALSQFCKKVISVDVDEKVLACAQKNAEVYGRKNIEFIHADYHTLDLKKLNVTAVFSDPLRRVNGKRVKELNETQPNTLELIRWIQSQGISDFAIEVSRHLSLESIPFDCERALISSGEDSSHAEPNNLTLYFGSFKKSEKSLTLLPENIMLSTPSLSSSKQFPHSLEDYLYELNPGIGQAGLYTELFQTISHPIHFFKENFLTSNELISSPFFRNSFQVLAHVSDESELLQKLNELHAGKIVLRGRMNPEQQKALKQSLESQLTGSQKLHVFFGIPILICKNLAIP